MNAFRRFFKDESGTTAVEYAVMLGLIIITALGAISTFGNAANTMWQDLIVAGLSNT